MQNRDLFSFNISKHVRLKLIKSNYFSVDDFEEITAEKLSSETAIPLEECESVLTCLKFGLQFSPVSAADQLSVECQLLTVSTGSQFFDQLLGGGITTTRITEFCGLPGTGKTQLCMQLSINAQLVCLKNGVKGEAVYLDTEGSFTLERLLDMATGQQHHINSSGDGQSSIDELVEGVHYTRCANFNSLLEKINGLQQFLLDNSKVRLVIIDNITNLIRVKFDSKFNERNAVLQQLALTLLKLATKHEIAVVITNQMTTKIVNEDEVFVIPALGAHWSHAVCNRVLLEFDDVSERWSATLVKSSYAAVNKCSFDITSSGIRDVTI